MPSFSISDAVFGSSRSKTPNAKFEDAEKSQPPREKDANSQVVWDYSDQYHDVVTDGGRKPPPSIGSPTFVWHIGVWRKVSEKFSAEPGTGILLDKLTAIDEKYFEHDAHNEKFFQEINELVKRLQENGRVLRKDPSRNIDEFKFRQYELRLETKRRKEAGLKVAHAFKDYEPQSLAFTLWWSDSLEDGTPVKNQRTEVPSYSALRVRVQVVTSTEHVTLSFYIDGGKPYGHPQLYERGNLPVSEFGYRRDLIARYLTTLRKIGDDQIRQALIEKDRLPERGISANDGAALQEIADYFYDGIWRDFMKSFGINVEKGGRILLDASPAGDAVSEGEIFMDHRGLVMAVDGFDTPASRRKVASAQQLREELSPQTTTKNKGELAANRSFGALPRFDPRSNEPGAVLRAWWPFIRRVVPWADYRDMVGCGITDWRSLYVNSNAATGSFYGDEESASREYEVPNLNEPEGQSRIWSRRPVNYLVLTKGEPHREQIGRFVERINALATSRLFALKNLRTIKNAGTHIKLLGAELDGVLEYWGEKRRLIEDEYYWRLAKLYNPKLQAKEDAAIEVIKNQRSLFSEKTPPELLEKALNWTELISSAFGESVKAPSIKQIQKVPDGEIQDLQDLRVQELAILVKRVERQLVQIGSALDNIGNGGSGRLLFVINRAKVQMKEFERMWPSLEIGNIDGWVTYGQFVERSVLPTFDLIRSTGERLIGLRERLQTVTAMIQTSALIIESEETRSNTATLRRIQSNLYFLGVPIGLVISAILLRDINYPPKDLLNWLKVAAFVAVPATFFWKWLQEKAKGDDGKRGALTPTQIEARRLLGGDARR